MSALTKIAPALAVIAVSFLVACKRESRSSPAPPPPPVSVDGTRADLIVVLGSSTAAGVGPRDPRNAWVRRYERALAAPFPGIRVLNLAVGGQTTYHIQPDDFSPPPRRPSPARGRNVTAALSLSPRAIIVNMPSNDSAEGYSGEEQRANFERVAAAASAARVPLWVTTTQPRNFTETAQITGQRQVREAIVRRFGARSIDFWTGFATASGRLDSRFDAGDGVHLNDAGHDVLLQRVIAAGVAEEVATDRAPH